MHLHSSIGWRSIGWLSIGWLSIGCGGDDRQGGNDEVAATSDSSGSTSDSGGSTSESASSTSDSDSSSASDSSDSSSTTESDTTDTGPSGCQGDPEACVAPQECDIISGACVDPGALCTLTGDSVTCGNSMCGPGTVCDDQGTCIPIAPCGQVECFAGQCWGSGCVCERPIACTTATAEQLNGPFSTDIFGLDFADDCNAWMVTLRSGTDYLRRLTPTGDLSEWAGVSNLDMGEVKVLKALNPQFPAPGIDDVLSPLSNGAPVTVGGNLGEVAITYTCCPNCGCAAVPPQGVARLLEGDPEPLPIVIVAVATQGSGPFGNIAADSGPMGLTWADDLRLYVGNSTANGNFETADLMMGTQSTLAQFDSRVSAAAPVSAVHLLIGLETGELLRFNTETQLATPLVNLGVGITSLSHDSFTGQVYAGLADLGVIEVNPFTGEYTDFQVLPSKGRVAVSPDGKLWYVPAKYAGGNAPLSSWDLPNSL